MSKSDTDFPGGRLASESSNQVISQEIFTDGNKGEWKELNTYVILIQPIFLHYSLKGIF